MSDPMPYTPRWYQDARDTQHPIDFDDLPLYDETKAALIAVGITVAIFAAGAALYFFIRSPL